MDRIIQNVGQGGEVVFANQPGKEGWTFPKLSLWRATKTMQLVDNSGRMPKGSHAEMSRGEHQTTEYHRQQQGAEPEAGQSTHIRFDQF